MRAQRHSLLALLLVLAVLLQIVALAAPVHAATFTVNSALDEARNPAAPAGVCQSTPSGVCTLRAAIQTANALFGPDSITLPANPPYVLSLGTLVISRELTINGAGAATTIIDGGGTAGVFQLTSGPVSISGVTIQNGAAVSTGGGILVSAPLGSLLLNLTNSVVTNNRATAGTAVGGGIHLASIGSSLNLTDSTISNNTATNGGGGLRMDLLTTATVTGSTFSGNQVTGFAGGGGIETHGTLSLTNSTISGNFALQGTGAGLAVEDGSTTLLNDTVAANTGNSGAGTNLDVIGGGTTVNVRNTIIANPLAGPNCRVPGGGLISGGFNLDSSNTCGFNPAAGDLVNTNPQLGPLANNGGPTQTQALLVGSPAINAVAASNCPPPGVDQRGVIRPQGSACDIGAFEFQPASLIPGDINQDGIVDIRDYGIWRQQFGATNCGNPADLDGNCIMDIRDYGIWRQNFGHTAGAAARTATPLPAPRGAAVPDGMAPLQAGGSAPAVPLVPLIGGLVGLGGLAGWRRRRPPGSE